MPEADKMRIFREAINHCQDNRFTTDSWKSFHEIHCNISPYGGQKLVVVGGARLGVDALFCAVGRQSTH
jgi:hypothetical protein